MRWTHHLFSVVQFFQVLILVLGGIFCMVLPFAPTLRVRIADIILFKDTLFMGFGVILCTIGVILGVGFYFLQNQKVLQLSLEPPVSVDRDVLAALVQAYLQKRFPKQKVTTDVIIGESIEFVTQNLSEPDIEKHLADIEADVCQLLSQTVGYRKKFLMTFLS